MSTEIRGDLFSIGARLREERERLDLSQEELGKVLGVDRKVIRSYEGNKTSLRVDQLVTFADRGADAIYILTGRRVPIGVEEARTGHSPAQRLGEVIVGLPLTETDAEMLRGLAVRLAEGPVPAK